VGTDLALAVYAILLAVAAAVVWRRPVAALYLYAVGLALHNAVMAALSSAGLRGSALTVVTAWKEILLVVALVSVGAEALVDRRLPFRFGIVDALALAFGALVVAYAFVPQHVLGGHADRHAVALAARHDLLPVGAYFLGRSLIIDRVQLRRLAWTMLGVGGLVAALGLADVYLVSIGWWRSNGTIGYFRHLGFDYHGTGVNAHGDYGLPENFVYNTGSEQHFLRRLVSTFLSPLGSAYLFVVALVLGIALLRRRLAVALAVLAAAGLLWTFSRSSLIALAAGLVVLGFARRQAWPVAAAVLTIGIAVAWVHIWPHIAPTGHWTANDLAYQRALARHAGGTTGNTINDPSTREHLRSLREGFWTMVHHPQGYGLGNVGETAVRTATPLKAGESNYTELGVELGIVGAVVWLAWVLAILGGLLRSRREWAPYLAAAFAAVAVLAVQTDVLGVPWIVYCVWGLGASLLGRAASQERIAASREPSYVFTSPARPLVPRGRLEP
jgi:hypothetical protein